MPAAAPAQPSALPPEFTREFRGVWVASVANIDWPSKPGLSSWQQQSELLQILDRARTLNLNAVLLQVRPSADALYASRLEPWSAYLTGVEGRAPEPYYDPLTFAVREAHARGLELHAWFNPYRARHPSATSPAAHTHISVTHPQLVRTYGKYLWMDPGEPAVLKRTLDVMLDVVKRYDVDGIHIDDYFYPYPEPGPDQLDVPFPDSTSYARYRRRGGTLGLSDWRRHNVDTLVQLLYRRTKSLKPWVKVGISPFGIWRPGNPEQIKGFDSYEKLYGDSRRWLREGWIDYFTPQLYWPIAQTPQAYPVLLDWWLGENVKGRHLWPGHNASRAAAGGTWSPDELNAQVRATRATAATGDVLFSMRALMSANAVTRDSVSVGVATQPPRPAAAEAMADRLFSELYRAPALIPASPWLSMRMPHMPQAALTRDAASGDHVLRIVASPRARWITVRALTASGWQSFILPVAQRTLVLAPRTDPAPTRVLVSSVDRFGTESRPLELH
ncbi:MAG: family 10 glycosylhydrolase [Gemmatimonadaceae bacterium]|nr:family 10 glycosylhydrolase [Gemmatimonadaceae bacterium]